MLIEAPIAVVVIAYTCFRSRIYAAFDLSGIVVRSRIRVSVFWCIVVPTVMKARIFTIEFVVEVHRIHNKKCAFVLAADYTLLKYSLLRESNFESWFAKVK